VISAVQQPCPATCSSKATRASSARSCARRAAIRSFSKFGPEATPDVKVTTASANSRALIANSLARPRRRTQQVLTPKAFSELIEPTGNRITVVESWVTENLAANDATYPVVPVRGAPARCRSPNGSARMEHRYEGQPRHYCDHAAGASMIRRSGVMRCGAQ
jgi:hypothetical protein